LPLRERYNESELVRVKLSGGTNIADRQRGVLFAIDVGLDVSTHMAPACGQRQRTERQPKAVRSSDGFGVSFRFIWMCARPSISPVAPPCLRLLSLRRAAPKERPCSSR